MNGGFARLKVTFGLAKALARVVIGSYSLPLFAIINLWLVRPRPPLVSVILSVLDRVIPG